jgi:hypothetical protein
MSNYYDRFYGYTGMFPIIDDRSAESHVDQLREILSKLDNGRGSLFSRTGLVHGARLFIVEGPIYNGRPAREEHFTYSYLAMSITFDGELEDLAARIAEVGGTDIETIFSHCYGFEGVDNRDNLLTYLKSCQITTTFLYVDSDADLQSTLSALVAQKQIAAMIEQAQGCSPSQRKVLIRELAARLDAIPTLEPGDFMTSNKREA